MRHQTKYKTSAHVLLNAFLFFLSAIILQSCSDGDITKKQRGAIPQTEAPAADTPEAQWVNLISTEQTPRYVIQDREKPDVYTFKEVRSVIDFNTRETLLAFKVHWKDKTEQVTLTGTLNDDWTTNLTDQKSHELQRMTAYGFCLDIGPCRTFIADIYFMMNGHLHSEQVKSQNEVKGSFIQPHEPQEPDDQDSLSDPTDHQNPETLEDYEGASIPDDSDDSEVIGLNRPVDTKTLLDLPENPEGDSLDQIGKPVSKESKPLEEVPQPPPPEPKEKVLDDSDVPTFDFNPDDLSPLDGSTPYPPAKKPGVPRPPSKPKRTIPHDSETIPVKNSDSPLLITSAAVTSVLPLEDPEDSVKDNPDLKLTNPRNSYVTTIQGGQRDQSLIQSFLQIFDLSVLNSGTHARGFYGRQNKNLGSLINTLSVMKETGDGFSRYGKNRGKYGSGLMISLLEKFSNYFSKNFVKDNILYIGDIAKAKGGLFKPHASHQNGLDADLKYLSPWGLTMTKDKPKLTQNGRMIVVDKVGAGRRLTSQNVKRCEYTRWDIERNFRLWRLMVAQKIKLKRKTTSKRVVVSEESVVQSIFINKCLKPLICKWTCQNQMMEDPLNREVLRRLYPIDYHHDHFHLRLKCSPFYQGCDFAPELAAETGCNPCPGT